MGLPTAGTNLMAPLSLAVVTRLLADFGREAVAGFGVATKIEAFALLVVMALGSVMAPFVGQNWGARRRGRVERGLKLGFVFSVLWGGLAAVGLAIFARPLVELFDQSGQVLLVASSYLFIVPISYGARGVVVIACSAFNGMGRPLPSAFMILARSIVLYLPLAYLGGWLWGYGGIFGAASACNFSIGLIAVLWSLRVCHGRASAD